MVMVSLAIRKTSGVNANAPAKVEVVKPGKAKSLCNRTP